MYCFFQIILNSKCNISQYVSYVLEVLWLDIVIMSYKFNNVTFITSIFHFYILIFYSIMIVGEAFGELASFIRKKWKMCCGSVGRIRNLF